MANKPDYYQTLSLSKGASDSDIKSAYRRLAMKYHPDRNNDDHAAEERFKEVKEAYDVLSDPQKRAAYDQFGHDGLNFGANGGGGGAGFSTGDFGDIFDGVFGEIFGNAGGRRQRQRARGVDLQYNLELSFEQAIFGCKIDITIPDMERCFTCSGSGAKPGSKPVTCSKCGGQGQLRIQQGFFSIQQTCQYCGGRGQVIKELCTKCHGKGQTAKNKTISVTIPEGIDSDDRMRLAGKGQSGPNGQSGDLYVLIKVKPHHIFTREGTDLYCDIPVSFVTAALGGELEVPTLNSKIKLTIPEETQTGKVFRLQGKGVRAVRNPKKGDLFCRVLVETPVKLGAHQRQLLREFEESMLEGGHQKHSPKASSWFTSVKNFFETITGGN